MRTERTRIIDTITEEDYGFDNWVILTSIEVTTKVSIDTILKTVVPDRGYLRPRKLGDYETRCNNEKKIPIKWNEIKWGPESLVHSKSYSTHCLWPDMVVQWVEDEVNTTNLVCVRGVTGTNESFHQESTQRHRVLTSGLWNPVLPY